MKKENIVCPFNTSVGILREITEISWSLLCPEWNNLLLGSIVLYNGTGNGLHFDMGVQT